MNRKGIGVIVLLIVLGTIYFVFNPSKTALFPQCPFLLLTGFRCPGCGSQRAIHSLLHLDVVQAFSYNALLVSSIPIIVILIYAEMIRTKKPQLYSKIHRPRFIWIYFGVVVAWGIGRNVFGIWCCCVSVERNGAKSLPVSILLTSGIAVGCAMCLMSAKSYWIPSRKQGLFSDGVQLIFLVNIYNVGELICP